MAQAKFKIHLLSLVLFGIFTISCSEKSASNSEEVLEFETTNPIQIDTTINQEYVASIQAYQNIEIRARVKGYLEKVNVDEGMAVKKGQVLFTINNAEYKSELAKSKAVFEQVDAEFRAAEIELQNTKLLVDKKVISANQYQIGKAKLDALKAKREESKAQILINELQVQYSTLKAPFDGVVDRLPIKAGSFIDEGTLLTTFSDSKDVFAYFNVNESEYLEYAKNQKGKQTKVLVQLKLSNGEIYSKEGTIETIENEIDPATGNLAFRARFPNPEKLLKHGASGKVIAKKEIQNYWLIPQKSVFEIQERSYVFVENEQGIVKMKNLKPDLRIEHFYLCKSGFNASEKILIEGIQSIKQGQKIKGKLVNIRQVVNDLK